jgi:putative molybdopterin biosynthesis protein
VIREFAGRLLEWWGLAPYPIFTAPAQLAQRIASDLGYEEFVNVSAAQIGGRIVVMPHSRGNGVQMSLVRSNGFVKIPASYVGIEAGEEIWAQLMTPPSTIERNLLVCGVRDECIHVLGDLLTPRGFSLHCCNTLDAGALLILRERRCHAASVALPRFGTWQSTDLFSPTVSAGLVRVTVAEAELGITSRELFSLDDLAGARFINRPRGVPARLLIDEMLRRTGLSPEQVPGYDHQVRSEDGVLTAVKNESADAGICRKRAAERAALCWTPLGYESYDLVFPSSAWEDAATVSIIGVLKSGQFRDSIGRLGGYSTMRTGHTTPVFPETG